MSPELKHKLDYSDLLAAPDDGKCYELDHRGGYWAGSAHVGKNLDVRYGTGDEVTVRLDLGTNTVAFRVNGEDAGSPQPIPHGAYHFSFSATDEGISATIVSIK